MNSELQIAIEAAKNATLICGNYLAVEFNKKHEIHFEGNHEKIEADQIAEDIFLEEISKKVPKYSYISEETQKNTNEDIQFIIDPIEGTSNFLRGNPLFATQIAVLYKKEMIAAFVYEPLQKKLCSAVKGQGTYVNGEKVQISDTKPINQFVTSGSATSRKEGKQKLLKILTFLTGQTRTTRILGSTGLELSYLVQGKIDLHINIESNEYDISPGVLLVREAGGLVLNFEGKNWENGDKTLIATSKSHCTKLASLIRSELTDYIK